MATELWTPAGAVRHRGASRWPLPTVLRTSKGWTLDHARDEVHPLGHGNYGRLYRGPHGLAVMVSLDPPHDGLPELLHMSLSLPEGYPDWDLIYVVTRAVFGEDVDAMMPIPREEAFIHGMTEEQKAGRYRQVFHVVECPVVWPKED